MAELALRCAGCGAALRIPERVQSVACQGCGASLAIERAGGALYAVVDQELAHGSTARAAEPPALNPPSRTSAIAGGTATAAGGIAFAVFTLGSGSWAWVAAGAVVAAVGLAAALRALVPKQRAHGER